jgi:hypothetical protein
MVAGLLNRGVYWAPPRRGGHYARPNGFCGHHQPPDEHQGAAERPQDVGEAAEGAWLQRLELVEPVGTP